jgi:hypothetical protein
VVQLPVAVSLASIETRLCMSVPQVLLPPNDESMGQSSLMSDKLHSAPVHVHSRQRLIVQNLNNGIYEVASSESAMCFCCQKTMPTFCHLLFVPENPRSKRGKLSLPLAIYMVGRRVYYYIKAAR